MALKDYNAKRKFDKTSEPEGKTKKSEDKLIFVIQEWNTKKPFKVD